MSEPRKIEVGQYYHIYSRGVNRCDTYNEEIDYNRFQKLLLICNSKNKIRMEKSIKEEPLHPPLVNIFCYCLMPNHFHMIIQEINPGGISLFLQKVLSGYSTYFNKKYKRTGALFGSRFKDKVINNDVYFNHLVTYIKNNPIKILNSNYDSKEVLNENIILTEEEKLFAKNYPYKYFNLPSIN